MSASVPSQTNASGKGEYLPSPEEIEAACESIRREWSEAERYRRSGRRHRVEVTQATNHRLTHGQNRRLYG